MRFAYYGPRQGNDALRWGEQLLCSPPHLLAIDIETVSLDDRTVIGVGITPSCTEGIYVPMASDDVVAMLELVGNPTITKVYHNALYDLPVLSEFGADTGNIRDTAIMAHLLGIPRKLKDLASQLCQVEIYEISDVLPKGKTMLDLPYDVVATKCINDVMATMLVYHTMLPYVDEAYLLREMQLIPVLIRMSARGIRLDQSRREQFEQTLTTEMLYLKALAESMGFNPGSNKQVAYMLSDRGNFLPPKDRHWKKLDTSKEVLATLNDPVAGLVLAYRQVQKILGTYIKPWAGAERAYTRFHMFTETGRLASVDRNLQNIPPELRCMFLPDTDTWTVADYSQQELRVLAHISGDKAMTFLFNHLVCADCGKYSELDARQCTHCGGKLSRVDIHADNARFMGIGRRIAKNVTFAMVYGATPETIMATAKIQNMQLARNLQRTWSGRFPQAFEWITSIQQYGLRHRKVQTLCGRWLYLPYDEPDEDVIRKACNYPIQGSAAEITKAAMLRITDLDVILQVHDDLNFDGHLDRSELVRRGLENVGVVLTPMDVKEGDRWM